MPLTTPPLGDVRRRMRDGIAGHLPGADALVPNSNMRVLADTYAGPVHELHLYLEWVSRMIMVDTAETDWLERFGRIWLPGGRKAASYAEGSVTVTGTVGAIVAAGARFVTSDGIELEAIDGLTLSGPSGDVAVRAVAPGTGGNLETGRALSLSTAAPGIDGTATVAVAGVTGGADAESDASLRERVLTRIQEPPHGGAAHDYVAWAREMPGVTRAWCFPLEQGMGTVTVRFCMDDAYDDGIPEPADALIVKTYIDAVRPVTARDFFVVPPVGVPYDFTIADLAADTPAVRAAIDAEMRAVIRERGAAGAPFYANWMIEAVSAATGEDRHSTPGIANFVPANPGEMATPGTITYA